MPRKSSQQEVDLSFAFFESLRLFYQENRGTVRNHYKNITKKFLDYNDPSNATAFLRIPQFEALEMYVFLKEYLDNEPLHDLFKAWYQKEGRFERRSAYSEQGAGMQQDMLYQVTEDTYKHVFKQLKAGQRNYPNYIFALTMGTGKTILMATCIFYEFVLAHKHGKDKRYCQNVLVFAPDKTVLQSLKEIETFDRSKVVPPEYAAVLDANLRFHFLEASGAALSTLDGSQYNVIVSNTQKIILKKQGAELTPTEQMFNSGKPQYQANSAWGAAADLYNFDQPLDEVALTTNQRFEKLRRLPQLGVFVDEAHHAFGKNLAKDMGAVNDTRKTSLRKTVDELASSLKASGTQMVACYNYTGTPYVGNQVMPEVVYGYGLKEAIDKAYLKRVSLNSYTNTNSAEFVKVAVSDFLKETDGLRPEGMLPKMAFFASTIEELQEELRPAVEAALEEHGIPLSSILVNVGDTKLTSNDDIREFNRLDTSASEKKFILLVNKGKEGWNCRSLFSVAMYRQPKSKIFVLQASMRCMRSVGDHQHTAHIYLTEDNLKVLDDELQQNFRISAEELNTTASDKQTYSIVPVEPIPKVTLRRIERHYRLKERPKVPTKSLGLESIDTKQYDVVHTKRAGLDVGEDSVRSSERKEVLDDVMEKRTFSELTLVAEISRYLNKPCLEIQAILRDLDKGTEQVLEYVNQHNEVLYDHVIPNLFNSLFDIEIEEKTEEHEIELVKRPVSAVKETQAAYKVTANPEMVMSYHDDYKAKSFHLNHYCFDSKPEQKLFWDLLRDEGISKVWFTGMLTHGQSDFCIQYVDPESHTVRSYYPDFLVQKPDGSYTIVEVKGDHMIDDRVVQAKSKFATEMAVASGMNYAMISGTDAKSGNYKSSLYTRE